MQTATRPTDRKFGYTFAAIFCVLGIYGIFSSWAFALSLSCICAGVAMASVAGLYPKILAPMNSAWFLFGALLGRIVSPIVLGILFFVVITPTSLIARLFGRDELRLKRHPISSYWIHRKPPSDSSQSSFKHQF